MSKSKVEQKIIFKRFTLKECKEIKTFLIKYFIRLYIFNIVNYTFCRGH